MDRQSFLSSMPFLLPCPSSGWPPRRSAASKEHTPAATVDTILTTSPDSSYKFKLCLEPPVLDTTDLGSVHQQKINDIQPTFFGRHPVDHDDDDANKSFDPSMADIQVAIESTTAPMSAPGDSQDDSVLKGRVLFVGGGGETSAASSRTQTPLSSHKITPASMQRFPGTWPLFLYLKIDRGGVFQVDGKQLWHIAVVEPESQKPAHDKKPSSMPPSLLLFFDEVMLRIFPCPTSDRCKDGWKSEALESLMDLKKQLLRLSSRAAANTWSPCESSLPSSNAEAGQKDGYAAGGGGSHSHSTLTSSSSSTLHGNKSKGGKLPSISETNNNEKLQDSHLVRKAKRRRDAMTRSRAGMQSVETILEMPMSVCKPEDLLPSKVGKEDLEDDDDDDDDDGHPMNDSASDVVMPKTQLQGFPGRLQKSGKKGRLDKKGSDLAMGPFLTGIADDMAATYGTQAETQEVLQLYQREIEERRCGEMDSLLDAFFPSMPQRQSGGSSRKSRRAGRGRGDGGGDQHNQNKKTATKTADEVMKSVQRLMKKQNALVEERYSYLQLPTRG